MKIYWKVQKLAKEQGITITKLSFLSQVHRQSLYPFWKGTAEQIWFRTLVRLARALHVEPWELFEFYDDGNDDYLEISPIQEQKDGKTGRPEDVGPNANTRVDIRTFR